MCIFCEKRKASDFVLILNCHDRIESLEWLVRTDIRDIMKKYQEIKSEHEGEKLTEDEVKRRLLELVEKLKKLEQRSKRYINVWNSKKMLSLISRSHIFGFFQDLDKVRELDPTFVKNMVYAHFLLILTYPLG